jgi:hypothetical protein
MTGKNHPVLYVVADRRIGARPILLDHTSVVSIRHEEATIAAGLADRDKWARSGLRHIIAALWSEFLEDCWSNLDSFRLIARCRRRSWLGRFATMAGHVLRPARWYPAKCWLATTRSEIGWCRPYKVDQVIGTKGCEPSPLWIKSAV